MKTRILLFFLIPLLLALGCRRDMFNQPKANTLRESQFFADGSGARSIPAHTVSQNDLRHADAFYSGLSGTNPLATFPFLITRTVLERGQEQFTIYCVPCHGDTGDGQGMVAHRGMPPSPSLAIERLRTAPGGHFVDVITRGYGVMLPQAAQVTPEDRWAIAAYIRALQLSQHAKAADLPPADLAKLAAIP